MSAFMSSPLQKQLGTTLHKSQQRIDQRIKKWQDLRQAVESTKVSNKPPHSRWQTRNISARHSNKLCFHSALCTNGPGGERADLHWAPAFHREEVQWSQGDGPRPREDHRDAGGDTAGPLGGGDHPAEEETQRPGEALAHGRSHTLSTGEVDLNWGPRPLHDLLDVPFLISIFPFLIILQSWQSLSGPSGYEDLNNITVAPYYSFDATKRAIAALKLQVEEVSKTEMSKISGAGGQTSLSSPQGELVPLFHDAYAAVCLYNLSVHSEGSLHHPRSRHKDEERIDSDGRDEDKRGAEIKGRAESKRRIEIKRRTEDKRRFLEMWVIRLLLNIVISCSHGFLRGSDREFSVPDKGMSTPCGETTETRVREGMLLAEQVWWNVRQPTHSSVLLKQTRVFLLL